MQAGFAKQKTEREKNMNELTKYEAAKYALAEAKAVDEVKHIHDVSAAMKAYARQAKDKQMEIDASEIRIRAERRLGEMIREQKETVGLNRGGGEPGIGRRGKECGATEEPHSYKPTLSDAGIDKKLSARSQQIAAIPEDEFESTLAEHREQQQAVTAKTMEKLSKKGSESILKETKPFSLAGQYVDLAIMQLDRIEKKDPNAIVELERLENWIAKTKERMKK